MAKRSKDDRWWWLTKREKFDHQGEHHLLDILRYDGAMVHSNAPDGFYLFSSDGTYSRPNLTRLRSYSVEPEWICANPMSEDAVRFEIQKHLADLHRRGEARS